MDELYDEMMPLCSQMIGIAQGIADGEMKLALIGASATVEGSNKSIEILLKQKEEALKKLANDKCTLAKVVAVTGMNGSGKLMTIRMRDK